MCFFSVTRRSWSDNVSELVSQSVSQSVTLRTELTDVTLVSGDTYWRFYWCNSGWSYSLETKTKNKCKNQAVKLFFCRCNTNLNSTIGLTTSQDSILTFISTGWENCTVIIRMLEQVRNVLTVEWRGWIALIVRLVERGRKIQKYQFPGQVRNTWNRCDPFISHGYIFLVAILHIEKRDFVGFFPKLV